MLGVGIGYLSEEVDIGIYLLVYDGLELLEERVFGIIVFEIVGLNLNLLGFWYVLDVGDVVYDFVDVSCMFVLGGVISVLKCDLYVMFVLKEKDLQLREEGGRLYLFVKEDGFDFWQQYVFVSERLFFGYMKEFNLCMCCFDGN